jgi:hypothetical protein
LPDGNGGNAELHLGDFHQYQPDGREISAAAKRRLGNRFLLLTLRPSRAQQKGTTMTKYMHRRTFGRFALAGTAAAIAWTQLPEASHALIDDIGAPYRIPGALVAANPQDRYVFAMGDYVVVVTDTGDVFAHEVRGKVEAAYGLGAGRIIMGPDDKWMVPSWVWPDGYGIIVVDKHGHARWYGFDTVYDWSGVLRPTAVREPVPIICNTLIGARPEDRRALVLGSRFLVLTSKGDVGAHVMIMSTFFGDGYLLARDPNGPVAKLNVDKWVLGMDSDLVVITTEGKVFAHHVAGDYVNPAYQLSGPLVAANPQDRWVLAQNDRVLVVTNKGEVFAHQMFQNKP